MSKEDIAKGKTRKVLEQMTKFCHDIGIYSNDLLMQLNRLTKNQNQRLQDVIDSKELDVTDNQITEATIQYYDLMVKSIHRHFTELQLPISATPFREQVVTKTYGAFANLREYFKGDSAMFFKAVAISSGRTVMLRVFKQLPDDGKKEVIPLDTYLKLQHRNVIEIVDTDMKSFPKYMVLEYINGISLDKMLRSGIPLWPAHGLDVLTNLARAIQYLHDQGIIHGRIRPSKILIDHELEPVVSPFETYHTSSYGRRSMRNFVQELKYAAPEIIAGETAQPTDLGDQFSFGLVAFEILTGKALFQDKGASSASVLHIMEKRNQFKAEPDLLAQEMQKLALAEDIAEDLTDFLGQCLATDPSKRFRNMRALVRSLQKICIEPADEIEIVRESYLQCCIMDSDFTELFYERLLQNQDIKAVFDQYHQRLLAKNENVNIVRVRRDRRKMLRSALFLLLSDGANNLYAQRIKSMPQHTGLQASDYAYFIETLRLLVKEKHTQWNDELEDSWQKVCEQAKERFGA